MKIVVSAQGETLDAPASPVFGRCPAYLFVDTESMQYEAVANPAMDLGGGAGIQAAQFVVERGAQAVLSGNLGPNAFGVLQAAGVPGYLVSEGTVRQAVEAFKAGRLQPMGGANVDAHAGIGGATVPAPGTGAGMGMGRGQGMGRGRGMGRGTGMGRGQGMGQGTGMGRGMGTGGQVQPAPVPPSEDQEELAQLRESVQRLQEQLAETLNRLNRLEGEQ